MALTTGHITHSEAVTVGYALERYFDANGLDRTYSERWVKLRAGPLTIIAAARIHDVHHLATDYSTNWTGETEIAAWELGGGCGRHWPAWTLNLGAAAIGLLIAPRRVYRAFVRGRHSRNLYRGTSPREVLSRPLADLRRTVAPNADPLPTMLDRLAFGALVILLVAWVVLFPLSIVLFVVSLYAPTPKEAPDGR
jgi:hypothetical protein